MSRPGPPVLHPYDPAWSELAERLIAVLREASHSHPDWDFDHIGSTSVPGLAAKNIIDLQVRVPTLPTYDELDDIFEVIGFRRELGARPDSPGVDRDNPRGAQDVPDDVWEKRLYVRPGDPRVVLHVRCADSPFGVLTIWFRDWLRAHKHERDRYADIKQRLAQAHADDGDFDDYTGAKTGYFDEVQPLFESWGRARDVENTN